MFTSTIFIYKNNAAKTESYKFVPSKSYKFVPSKSYTSLPSESYKSLPSESYKSVPSESYKSVPSESYKSVPSESYTFVPSESLKDIAMNSGLSEEANITVCNLKGLCEHLNGNEQLLSVASLMKLPIAVALIEKITTNNIDINTQIYLEPENFTEDNSTLDAGNNYTLKELLSEMIINSSNIAPNQLIDYLSRSYINQVLEEQDYKILRVNSKFIGDYIIPYDMGFIPNTANSDELTIMMVRIYSNLHLTHYKLLATLLAQQHDHDLGFTALENTKVQWMGEKTGQNAGVLGTTLAIKVSGEIYIITVIDDGDYSEIALRKSITNIADYIFKKESF
ncbi:MAG: serine hydrolase [Okeania sp.]|nr:serine hydrolase [Okeania sp.]